MISEPLELEIVAAHLQKLGHTVDLVDLILERRPLTWFLTRTTYDIVAFAGYTDQPHVAKQLANDTKRVSPETMVVVGGVNAEVSPTDFVDPDIDHILWANGALTIGEIASGLPAAEAACLPGVWGSGKIRPTALHPAGMLPDRTVTAQYRSRYGCIYHIPCATVQTSYGCPSTCRFCFCTQIAPYAERDLNEVMDELEQITEPHVLIVDDDFLSGTDRVRAFCEALDTRGLHKLFVAFGRADYVVKNPADIAMLAEHGLDALFMCIEPHRSDDPSDDDTGTSSHQSVRAVRVLAAAGVQCYSGLSTGEDWGRADFAGLAGFINQFDHPMVNVQPITPLPGTPPYDDEQGHLALRRITAERWDMAHLGFRPTALSPRAYCWELLKTYYRTSASSSQLRYIRRRYGNRVYRRVLRVAVGITWQYVKLIVRPL
jgi:radical SAM superfamily enzyme YgiQ (UPF0313 family)